jgi:predicted RecA/RadA family phage recombinase
MAKNHVQPGETITLLAPYDVAAGDGFLVGSIFAIALYAALSGAAVEGRTVDVWDIKKTAAQTFTQGAKVYWDNTAKSVTGISSGNSLIGIATQAAGGADASARVRLNGISI